MTHASTLGPEPDEDLMRLFRAGRMDALGVLYDRHAPALLAYLSRMVENPEGAHDLLHDCMLSVARAAGSYEYPRPVRPWLFTIARNLALNHVKRSIPTPVSEDFLEEHGERHGWFAPRRAPLEEADVDERKQLLRDAFGTLSPAEKELVFLRLTQGLRFKEIAEVTGWSTDTVRQRMSRAVKKLRKLLPPG